MNSQTTPTNTQQTEEMLVQVPLTVLGVSALYSVALGWLERKFPIKPDHTWAEVAGGVLITLVPVALKARKNPNMDWRTYEDAIWRCFIASGTPIILWQLGESVYRHVELLKYAAGRETRSISSDANPTTTLAVRDGDRTGVGLDGGERSDSSSSDSSR
jgi:hypothetical protein